MKYYIKFEQDGFVNGELVFEKGKIYSFDKQESAIRWINRGHTEVLEKEFKNQGKKVAEPTPPPAAPPVPPTPPSEPKNSKDSEEEDGL